MTNFERFGINCTIPRLTSIMKVKNSACWKENIPKQRKITNFNRKPHTRNTKSNSTPIQRKWHQALSKNIRYWPWQTIHLKSLPRSEDFPFIAFIFAQRTFYTSDQRLVGSVIMHYIEIKADNLVGFFFAVKHNLLRIYANFGVLRKKSRNVSTILFF